MTYDEMKPRKETCGTEVSTLTKRALKPRKETCGEEASVELTKMALQVA